MLESLIIRDIEIPFLIKRNHSVLNAIRVNNDQDIEEKERSEYNKQENLKHIEKLEGIISQLESIKESTIEDIRDKFLLTQDYDVHVLLFYTNKENGSQIDLTVKRHLQEFTYQLLDKDLIKRGRDKVYIIVDTNGGSPDIAIQIYDFLQSYFKEPTAIIPDSAWSAGTLFSLCCHRIILLDNALLGPIDVHVRLSEDDGYYKSAFSYIEGVEEYLDLLIKKVDSSEINPSNQASVSSFQTYCQNFSNLMLPINLTKYGHCKSILDHAANAIALRHFQHETTCNDFAVVQNNIWDNFTSTGRFLGHGYGFNYSTLKGMKSFEGYEDYIDKIEYGGDLFRWIYAIHSDISKSLRDHPTFYFFEGYKEAYSYVY